MADIRNGSNFNIVDEIKSRCNIVDVIGQVVALKKAGSVYKGLCPFHREKTPSFVVYEGSQHYKCFGCNEGGDVINFVQKYYNLDFRESCEKLAEDYGIEIPEDGFKGQGNSKKNDEFFKINRDAAEFFYRALREKENPGYAYMKKRGISDETLKEFNIGYADEEWTSLTDFLRGKGYDPEKLVELGLVSKKEKRYYDKFRGRVIFPIRNTAGKFIGFGGRVLDDSLPKYMNSNESSVFLKKNNLYGLNLTKDSVHKEGYIVLVEGYMDVISLYQSGVRNVSASLGTALTDNQARLIKRYTQNVILSYDADSAGQNAALRGLDILYKEDCRAKVLVVSDGKDPDEFIKANGRDAFLELVNKAVPYGDFKLAKAKQGLDIKDNQQKLDYLRKAVDILRQMKPVEADMYIKKVSKETGISEQAIRLEYEGQQKDKIGQTAFAPAKAATQKFMSEAEQDLIKLMLIDHDYSRIPDEIKGSVFLDPAGSSIYKAIQTVDKGERPLDINKITDQLDVETSELLKKITSKIIPPDKEEAIYNDCISHLIHQKLMDECDEITMLMSSLDNENDAEEIDRLMIRLMEIQKKIKG